MTDHEKIKQAVRLFLEKDRQGLIEGRAPGRHLIGSRGLCEELYGGMDQDASPTWQEHLMWKTAGW